MPERAVPSSVVRPRREGDFGAVATLFAEAFGVELDHEVFTWKYGGGPDVSQVAVDDGEVVGHIGARLQRIVHDGTPALASDFTDNVTSGSARGLGTWQRLARAVLEATREHGGGFCFGFPSNYLLEVSTATLERCDGRRATQLRRKVLDPPTDFPGDLYIADQPPRDWDDRWARLAADERLWVARDRDYLRRRYTARPDREYRFVNSGPRDALAVIGLGPGDAHLMELIAPAGDAATLGRLALAAEHAAADTGAGALEAWFPAWSAQAAVLSGACGFEATDAPHALNVVAAADGPPVTEIVDTFFYSLGDWDVR